MAENRICPDCGGEMPPNTLGGHCPRCLARIVFGAPRDPSPRAAPSAEGEKEAEESRKGSAADISESDLSGEYVGRYKLLEKIGEGGFGIVYMAEQLEPVQRKVALKLIKPGMDSRAIIARFEAERQALALMDHPNIARFYDAGATSADDSQISNLRSQIPSGRPYFVMELVRGTALTDYCDRQQLPTRTRLELFIQVCQAVQHAHQKGIIHRDLKPSNVLVTLHDGQAVPKIIDFGIAKALDQKLTDRTLFTGFAQLLGTPAYMSPEQAELSGLDIDTRSDIYSLGVLLYELLTGVTPFDKPRLAKAALDEIRRLIRETDAPKPSARLSGLSAAEQTTVARCRQIEPPKLIHLVRGDLDWIVMKCLEKERSRRYETANGLAREIERFLNEEPVSARPPSRVYRFQKLVRRNKLAVSAVGAVTAALALGLAVSSFLLIRERQARARAGAAEIKARNEAAKSTEVARLLRETLTGAGPAVARGRDTKVLKEILDQTALRIGTALTNSPLVELELRDTLGEVYTVLGVYPRAEEMFRRALTLREQEFGKQSADFAAGLHNLSGVLYYEQQVQEAASLLREALRLYKETGHEESKETVVCLNDLANVLEKQEKLAEAESLHRASVELGRRLLPKDDPELASSLSNLANCLRGEGKFTNALAFAEEALEIRTRVFGTNDLHVADSLTSLGDLLTQVGNNPGAEAKFRQSLAIQTNLLKSPHPDIATTLCNLANLLWAQRKMPEAEAQYRAALQIYRELSDSNGVAVVLSNLAGLSFMQDRFSEAESNMVEVLAIERTSWGAETARFGLELGKLATVRIRQGKLEEALEAARECLGILERTAPDSWETPGAKAVLGWILLERKLYDQAEPYLVDGCKGLLASDAAIPTPSKGKVRMALQRLIGLYDATHQPEKAAGWRAELAGWEKANPTTPAPK